MFVKWRCHANFVYYTDAEVSLLKYNIAIIDNNTNKREVEHSPMNTRNILYSNA